ncbi:MAG: carboxypeptidase-like regulatory domain-containing protein [Chitinophagaceae bacterium]|nr:carboxypeptidase-like regulatory domain-containing protein [Chitinophagaceae bacterium]
MRQSIIIQLFIILLCSNVNAQSLLSATVSIKAKRQPLHEVLTIIGNEATVNFSYNTKAIKRDTLLSVSAVNKPLREVLRMIFDAGYEFKESGNYIIIRRKPVSTTTIVSKPQINSDFYLISGYVVDDETGEKIPDATIYEKQHLISSMTDERGFFTLKLKSKYPVASVSVSKTDYSDTAVQIRARYDQQVTIALSRKPGLMNLAVNPKYFSENEIDAINEPADNPDVIEKKWIGRVLFSSKQRIRSLNLKKFYTTRAYQFSFVPGISTHGKMNAQVISQTSINLIGGYSGGVNAVEIGGLFNIDKKNVKSLQLAGLFNVVGRHMKGLQVACLFNQVEGSVDGLQIGGAFNLVRNEVNGIQIATLYNKARSVKGLQIGFVNRTETQEGTSIGFVNISKNKKGKNRVGFILRLPRK